MNFRHSENDWGSHSDGWVDNGLNQTNTGIRRLRKRSSEEGAVAATAPFDFSKVSNGARQPKWI